MQRGWRDFGFEEIALRSDTFCPLLNGIRIVQLSDLHLSKKVNLSYMQNLIKQINDSKADILLITGDILQTSAHHIEELLRCFKELQIPSYYVSGNHDIVYGIDALEKIMSKNSVICLDNKIETVVLRGRELQLVGLSDRYSFVLGIKRPIKELFCKLNPTISTILLAHQPKDVEYIEDFRIDIQLSGHTHGGQIYPFSLVVKFFQPYFSGLYRVKNTLLYVSRGVGYWGFNIRYKASSQIPLFTIN